MPVICHENLKLVCSRILLLMLFPKLRQMTFSWCDWLMLGTIVVPEQNEFIIY